MPKIPRVNFYFNRLQILILILVVLIFFYPNTIEIMGIPLLNEFIRQRVLSLGILFLILRGLVDAYYSPNLAILFLVMLILSPTLTFGQLTIATLFSLVIFRVLK